MLINGRGDYLMNLPTLRALSAVFAGELVFITKHGVAPLFYPGLPFSRIVEIDCEPGPTGPEFDVATVSAAIEGCDLFLSLNPWSTRSLDGLLWNLRHVPAVGFSSGFSLRLPLDFSKHSVDLAFDIVRCLDDTIQVEQFADPPRFAPRFEELARHIRAAIPADARVVCVHGDTKPEKMWDEQRFVALIRRLLRNDPRLYALDLGLRPIGGSELANEARMISCRELILPAAFALTGLADFFVGVDSCFLHAADLYRVPGVGLFGPTNPHEFGFRFGPHSHVAKDSISDITLDDVTRAIEAVVCAP